MNETTSPLTSADTTSPARSVPTPRTTTAAPETAVDRRLEQRAALKSRHAQGLTRLLEQRADLRGVNALADLVDDAVRWTA